MSKRSREESFSPSTDEVSTPEALDDGIDADLKRPSKHKQVDILVPAPHSAVMKCSLPLHKDAIEFQSQEDYEVHYLKEHTNRCSSCGKNFPTAHFLGLHIEENHNALRETLQAKGEKTYGCFVEDCDRKCSTPQKRRLHLIDKHGFPKFYNFRIIDHGIDKATSLLREGQRRRVSLSNDAGQLIGHRRRASSQAQALAHLPHKSAPPDSPETGLVTPPKEELLSDQKTKPTVDVTEETTTNTSDDIGELAKSMSALRFVPPSVMLRNSKKT